MWSVLLDYFLLHAMKLDNVKKIPRQGELILARITEVYDGDTCTAVYRYGNKLHTTKIRITGIDCPEIKGAGVQEWEKYSALVIRDHVRSLILGKHKFIRLDCLDKYGGRMVGDVYLKGTRQPLSEHLIKQGYAKPYGGKTKDKWTKEECVKIE